MPTRRTYLAATFNGSALSHILSASCHFGWKQSVPDATIFVTDNPLNPGGIIKPKITVPTKRFRNYWREKLE